MRSFFALIYSRIVARSVRSWAQRPLKTQEKVFEALIREAKDTSFGRDHDFSEIRSFKDFRDRVPVRDYEAMRSYVERVRQGESDVLWKGRPLYFAKTSGTTSGAKYIPISRESMPGHIRAAREALLMYIAETGNSGFVSGKMIFLQGSPIMEEENGVKTGRLSGIVAHYVPGYLQRNRLPSWATNCIEDWETKVNTIVEETVDQDLRLISGIPSWVQMYFEKLSQKGGKQVGEIFPNFQLFVYGGVNYEPYRKNMEQLIGRAVDSIELYPASEGFFAYQDQHLANRESEKGMLLLLNNGIYYEFIPADTYFDAEPQRLGLDRVKTGVNYALVISTNAGLWAYDIGDTVMFTCLEPYRLVVTGRISHFISAFGEHVIGKEVEQALQMATQNSSAVVREFTVAPQVNPSEDSLPYHEWFIEFEQLPDSISAFEQDIDRIMQDQNSYYRDLIQGKVLRPLVISKVVQNGFDDYMRSVGKLGGQNKIPRLSNDRKIAENLRVLN